MLLLRRDRWQSIQTLRLLEGGIDYFERVEAVLAAAKKSIYLEVYIFSADSQAKKIVDILCLAAQRRCYRKTFGSICGIQVSLRDNQDAYHQVLLFS